MNFLFKFKFKSPLIFLITLPFCFLQNVHGVWVHGCRPLDPMVHPNFCSDREILCLKRHFVLVLFLLYFPVSFQITHIISLLFSNSKINFLFYFQLHALFPFEQVGIILHIPRGTSQKIPKHFSHDLLP